MQTGSYLITFLQTHALAKDFGVLNSMCEFLSIKWSLSVKHSFLLLYLMYYPGDMFRLSIESSSGPYIKNRDY
jgi:hypothetical protein